MKLSRLITAVPVLGAFLLLCSCASTQYKLTPQGNPTRSKTAERVTVSATFLSEDQVIAKYGEKNNPFLSPPSAFSQKKTMVFEAKVENQSPEPVFLRLSKIELQYGGRYEQPINRFHLSNFWEIRIQKNDRYRYWNYGRVKNVINRTVFANEASVTPRSAANGTLVFMGKFPQYGQADLHIPVFLKGELVHTFRFHYQF
ncbi:MAG: hypothetical protein ACOC7U_03740 [Spirochaetota bacterium]